MEFIEFALVQKQPRPGTTVFWRVNALIWLDGWVNCGHFEWWIFTYCPCDPKLKFFFSPLFHSITIVRSNIVIHYALELNDHNTSLLRYRKSLVSKRFKVRPPWAPRTRWLGSLATSPLCRSKQSTALTAYAPPSSGTWRCRTTRTRSRCSTCSSLRRRQTSRTSLEVWSTCAPKGGYQTNQSIRSKTPRNSALPLSAACRRSGMMFVIYVGRSSPRSPLRGALSVVWGASRGRTLLRELQCLRHLGEDWMFRWVYSLSDVCILCCG